MTFNETSDPRDTSLFNCTISGAPLASYLQPWSILAGVVIAGSCLLGVPANFTIIAQLGRHLRGSSMTQRLFFNLALSDLLCLLCLPIGMYVFYSGTCLMDGLNRCLFYCFIFCVTTDLNILVLISIQRYYQVLHPEKWVKVDRMWQRILLFSVWMLGAFVALPAVFMTRNEARTEKTATLSCFPSTCCLLKASSELRCPTRSSLEPPRSSSASSPSTWSPAFSPSSSGPFTLLHSSLVETAAGGPFSLMTPNMI
ncbi:prokineticin receptor 2-like isoform X5 [Betta splendens]|uniref:Prokineticin receptor 2-like isoform X5 n=1 Tax=Betta splendens TaxID=158456 RepID=A0A9W2Y0L7_BETSP|nr:prokineticin receptor 2-like isoform X5 [Betta splendens]